VPAYSENGEDGKKGGVNGEDAWKALGALDSLYRAFVGFLTVDTDDTKISSATFLCSHFSTLIELLNEVPRQRLAVVSRIYYKFFHYFILFAS
jgi:hypothetical protein